MNLIFRLALQDFLFRGADIVLQQNNPCQIRHVPDREGKDSVVCIYHHPCCSGCRHERDYGCSVTCISCKVFLCHAAATARPSLETLFRTIRHTIYSFQLPQMRESVPDWFKQMRDYKQRLSVDQR